MNLTGMVGYGLWYISLQCNVLNCTEITNVAYESSISALHAMHTGLPCMQSLSLFNFI